MSPTLSRRRALLGSAAAAVGFGVPMVATAAAPVVVQAVSPEAAALQAEFCRLSSTYRHACREADATNEATPEVDPPEALFWQPGDHDNLWGRFPVESWASPGRHWYGDADLVEKLRADPFRTLAGTPTAGAARRDDVVAAWDCWRVEVKASEDASGYTAAEARYNAAHDAYSEFRSRLVDLRTDDPEMMTVKALAIADLCRGMERFEACITAEIKYECGAYEGALSLSLARDFIGLLGADVGGARG